MKDLDDRTILRLSRQTKLIAAIVIVGLVAFLMPLLFLQKNAPTQAKHPGVRIDTPLVLVRGHRCLLTETKVACKLRFPAIR